MREVRGLRIPRTGYTRPVRIPNGRWLDGAVVAIWVAVVVSAWWTRAWRVPYTLIEPVWVHATTSERIRYANVEALRAEGDGIVASIQAHAEQHGRPPASLDELGDLPEGWRDWSYTRHDPDGAYSLRIGHYPAHGFFLRYSSRRGDWYLDA